MAHDGPAALAHRDQLQPTIALLDIGLPVMDGYELARRLRASELPAPSLVALTGYGQDADAGGAATPASTPTWSSRWTWISSRICCRS